MKINVKELKEALAIVKPGLAGKDLMAQTTSFAFVEDFVLTYNDSISIRHPLKNVNIEGAVEAEQLYNFLGKLKKEEIEMEIGEKELLLKYGKSIAGFRLEEEIKLPLADLKVKKLKWKQIPKGFLDFVERAKNVCANDMSKPMLTCVHVTKKGIVEATNSFQIFWGQIEPIDVEDFLIPAISVKTVVGIKPIYIARTEGWVHFKSEVGTIISCRVFNDKFVDTGKFLNVEGNVINFPKKLLATLDKAEVFSKREFILEEIVMVSVEDKNLHIESKSDYGWYKEDLSMHYKGDAFEFRVAPKALINILNDTNKGFLNDKLLIFKGENWKYLTVIVK